MENIEPDYTTTAPSAASTGIGSNGGALDSLQFQRAEISEKACAACSTAITSSYFQLNGVDLCAACAGQWEALQQPPSARAASRGILYGFGGAIAGAALMAIISAVTGYQFALAAIAVGWLVGKGFRKGTGGLGGRHCQWLAVALTYFGITASTVPDIIREVRDMSKAKTEQTGASNSGESATGESTTGLSTNESESKQTPVTAGQFVIAVAFLVGLGLLSPFLMLTTGISGLINLVIVFFGLQQAWRLTAGDPRVLTGPLEPSVAGEAAP